MVKSNFILLIPLIISVTAASPVDTAYDFLDAVDFQDGYALEELFSADLYTTFIGFLDQARGLMSADPVLAENFLASRYGGRISISDFDFMNNEEIFGLILGEIYLLPSDQIQQETAEMQGRTATVVVTYLNGSSISFSMVWENSNWRITDTSLLTSMFR